MKTGIEKTSSAFMVSALMIPVVEAAAGRNWLPVVMEAAAAWLIYCWMPRAERELPYWLECLRTIAGILVTGWLLSWTAKPWQGEMAEYVVPAVLLILAVASLSKGEEKAKSAVNILRYGIYAVLILLLVAGAGEIKWNMLPPRAEMPDGTLACVLLLLLMEKGTRCSLHEAPLAAAAIAASIFTVGNSGIYEYSKSVSVTGVADHLESVAAAAMTAGYFGVLAYLMMHFGKRGKREIAVKALIAYIAYCTGIILQPWIYAATIVVLWGILPQLCGRKEKRKKNEKSA